MGYPVSKQNKTKRVKGAGGMAQHEDLQNPFKGCMLCCMFVIPTLETGPRAWREKLAGLI